MLTEPVHPRVCGEQAVAQEIPVRRPGSSPRVRGTVIMEQRKYKMERFIPACAGNRVLRGADGYVNAGSSPRVRGTAEHEWDRNHQNRFIPACAGNSRCGDRRGKGRQVHPRVCGEQIPSGLEPPGITGSSPRVRGTAWSTRHAHSAIRFIPACAGNRIPPPIPELCLPVHPRVCGEQSISYLTTTRFYGSSPRVRGTAEYPRTRSRAPRFIPACAGNSAHA